MEVLIRALEFYANENNYKTTSSGFTAQYDPVTPMINIDNGKRAKKALQTVRDYNKKR
jgi:hypothetical protein